MSGAIKILGWQKHKDAGLQKVAAILSSLADDYQECLTEKNVLNALQSGHTDLVILAGIDNPKQSPLYKEICAQFPQVPVWIIGPDFQYSKNYASFVWQNPRHEVLSQTLSPVEWELRLHHTLQNRKIEQERNSLQNELSAIDLVLNTLKPRSMRETTKVLVELLGVSLDCSQVFWFEHHRFESIASRAMQTNRSEQRFVSAAELGQGHHGWTSWKPLKKNRIENFAKVMFLALAPNWQNLTDMCVVNLFDQKVLFMPIWDSESQVCLGHFFLLDPQNFYTLQDNQILKRKQQMIARHISFALEYDRVNRMNYIDDLTMLYNQRFLNTALDEMMLDADQSKSEFSVLFIDIDNFKTVNDQQGHMVGSTILTELGKIIGSTIRTTDYAFRYGGDEFIMLLSRASQEEGVRVAERLRQRISETPFRLEKRVLNITVSIGVATYPTHAKSKDELIHLADQAMYYAKNKCRNMVYVAG